MKEESSINQRLRRPKWNKKFWKMKKRFKAHEKEKRS
jgi:hypothetical protein